MKSGTNKYQLRMSEGKGRGMAAAEFQAQLTAAHWRTLLCFLVLILAFSSSAAEKGGVGISVDVVIEGGIFNPKIEEFKIKEVFSDSPAEKAGVKVGQKVLSIDGCVIPGCPARKAKKLMDKKRGEILTFEIENKDGTHELVKIHVS